MCIDTINMIAWTLEAEESMKNGSTTLAGGLKDYELRLNQVME